MENGIRVGNGDNGVRSIPVETICCVCDALLGPGLRTSRGTLDAMVVSAVT